MTTMIVLFNLKPGADPSAYEQWASSKDLPTVRNLESCDSFEVYRSTGLFGADGEPPYDYVEIINVNNIKRFGEEVASDTVQAIAAEFEDFADRPVFILTERIDT